MSKAPEVLLLVENLSVPADPRVWREAVALRQQGYEVRVICPKGQVRNTESYVCLEGIHIYRYTLNTTVARSSNYIKEYLIAMLKTFGLTFKVWSRHGFDVIHAANPPDTFFAIGLFYKLFGKKFIFDQHDLAPEIFHIRFQNRLKPLYHLLKFCERCSYRVADVVITSNTSQKGIAITRGGCRPEKVFVVRNGPDLASYKTTEPEPGLKGSRRYLLAYVGVMGMQDGVDYAIRALYELVHKRGRQDVSFVLMGSGDQLEPLKALTRELGLETYVNFTGWLAKQDLLRYLAAADIGISPDPANELNDHSTMLKTMEYMAMGKPVVAFDLPETRYSAQDAALYATPNSIEEFADKIEILLDNEDLRRKMGAFGRQRVETELCWDRTRVNLWHAYATLFPAYRQPLNFEAKSESEEESKRDLEAKPLAGIEGGSSPSRYR
ncbi:MAG: glycosyltransferase family 4 protein [Ktedonobacteraceae bacterium]|nr:glycosyltransferase family 4 protein [Ktedonobacteraceae bacterium]